MNGLTPDGEFDLYVSRWDSIAGEWSEAKLVLPPLNYDKCVCSCWETADGKLYMGSEIWEGVMGEEDIMVALRPGAYDKHAPPPAGEGRSGDWVKT